MKPSENIAVAVYAEQVATVYRQMPIAIGANFVNAALTAAVLTPIAARPVPLLWFGAVLLVSASRAVAWWRYRRGNADAGRWALPATLGAMFAGLCWGLGGAVLFPFIPPLAQAFLTIVIGGMCAGSVVLSGPHLPTLLAFVLPACLPMAGRFLVEGTAIDRALGAMIVVFVAAMTFAGTHLNRIFVEAMRLRFELNEANLRLQSEISEHRATEAALHQAQKLEAIGHLTGGIAHDFNNLLTVVIGNLTLARGRADGNGAIAPLLDSAMQAAGRGVAQIQRLLGFARRQRLDPRSVDLSRLVADINALLRQTLGPGIDLLIAADADLAPAHVDANQLELAILNLVINARDAMPAGGSVRIGLENHATNHDSPPELTPGKYVVMSIADTGTGMDAATLAQAFDPFFTTKDAGAGSGLGLPTVQGFAAQSGGAVRIGSKPDAGTTVELWLPKADEPPGKPAGSTLSVSPIGRGAANILVCDDDDDVRRFVGEFLGSVGYTIHEANGPIAALGILDNQAEIDLLIVDYAMPVMNGLETIQQARRRRPDLKPLLITGYAGAVGGGAADIPLLRKPFAPAELARRVAEILMI
jgi:signal transduction histidine kinase/CheY-like chemotaxis protein